MFKLYECDVGIKAEGITYQWKNISQVAFEDNERNRLTRGANATDEVGIAYKDGIKEAKRILPSILEMPSALHALFQRLFKDQVRFEFFCTSRKTGSSLFGKNCILSNRPMQLNLDETAESLEIAIEIETFKLDVNIKDADAV